jgi:excinuclease ABC subunit A
MVDAVLALPADTRLMVLAPVVRDRKGEFAELFADMQARGYVRFRIGSGGARLGRRGRRAAGAEEDREARHRRRHRPPARAPDMKQRLAESFEAALRIADGRAIALELPGDVGDTGRASTSFSNRFACPVCSYALSELEPRLFSFNSPVGACPSCDGLGQVTAFDPERVVAFPS